MPLHKGRQSRLVTTAEVVLQQLPIGPSCPIPQKHRPAKVLDNLAQLSSRHVPSFGGLGHLSTLLLPARAQIDPCFSSTGRSSSRTAANCQIGSATFSP